MIVRFDWQKCDCNGKWYEMYHSKSFVEISYLKTWWAQSVYLFYLLNSSIVQKQIEMRTFVQATLSTLGNRIMDLELPIHKDKNKAEKIAKEIEAIIQLKKQLKQQASKLIEKGL